MDFCCLLAVYAVLILFYYYLTKNYNYWKHQNVPFATGAVPGFGHIFSILTLRDNLGTLVEKLYQKMGKNSMYGCFVNRTPALVLRDPDLIKTVLQSDFASFRNNLVTVHEESDPILSKNPFFAKDEVWTESRSLLANNFSGKKLRALLSIVLQVSDRFTKFVNGKVKSDEKLAEFEAKELFTRVSAEIIANSAFGIEGESFQNNPSPLAVLSLARKTIDPSLKNGLQLVMLYFFPRLAKCLGVSIVSKEVNHHLKYYLKSLVKRCQESEETPEEFLQFSLKDLDVFGENAIAAQATSILFDGYEAMSSVLSFMAYRLAANPRAQDKAREEVKLAMEKFDDNLSYEALSSMNYMEQAVLETLRLDPGFGDLTRVCNKEISLRGRDGLACHLKPGDIVFISVSGLHMDEEFWPNPTNFVPERFDADSAARRHKYTYLGFAAGPRMCPGMRMGIMIVKAVMAVVLRNYRLRVSSRMNGPLVYNTFSFATIVKDGLWLDFEPIHSKD